MSQPDMSASANERTIVHIGCGNGAKWRGQSDQGPRLVLIEPNPDYSSDLKAVITPDRGDMIIPAAVSGSDGSAPFYVLSFAELSGLHPPAPLQQYLPGLRVEKYFDAQTLSVATLLKAANLTGTDNELIVEAMGQEAAILEDVIALEAAGVFSSISIRLARVSLFDGSLSLESASSALQAYGFRPIGDVAGTDPDWPLFAFHRDAALLDAQQAVFVAKAAYNQAQQEITQYEAKLAGVLATLAETQDGLSASAAQIAVLQQERHAAATSHTYAPAQVDLTQAVLSLQEALAENEIALAQSLAQVSQLQLERDQALAACAQATADISEEALSRQETLAQNESARAQSLAQIMQLEQERDVAKVEHEQARAVIAQISQERDAALSSYDQARQHATNLEAELALMRTLSTDLENRWTLAQQDKGLTLRLQVMAASDLKELQARYSEVLARKESQDLLIAQLMVRLGDAVDYLKDRSLAGADRGETPLSKLPMSKASNRGRSRSAAE